MTTSTPVEGVVKLLAASGYRPLPSPLSIAGLSFEVPAALVGEHPSPDLILVADTAFEADVRILRKVEGVARALDVVRSKRPLTTILVGPKPKASVLDAMTKVCRVLATGVIGAEQENPLLQNWLAVLLPLALPEPSDDIAEPLQSIVERSNDLDTSIVDLVALAANGAEAVQARLHELLTASLAIPDADEPGPDEGTNLTGGIFE